MELPRSLWPALHRIATGRPWPPSTAEDARRFVDEAKLQFLLPLLAAGTDLPKPVTDALVPYQAIERLSAARSAILTNELHQLIALLHDEEVVLLKGSDYGHRLYDRSSLRPMADIDIFVPSERLASVAQRLQKAGYHRSFHGGAAWRLTGAYEYVFTSEKAMIEVHQAFLQRSRTTIDYDAIWRGRVPMPRFPPNVFRLGDVDAIAYHALSMASDEFETRLIRDVDFWLLLRAFSGPFQQIADRAAAWSVRRALFGALTIAATLFPDLHSDEYDRVSESLLPPGRRRFLVRRVLPDPFKLRYRIKRSRAIQLWRKFWLMDSIGRRMTFLLHHVYASVAGQLIPIARRTERSASNAPSSTGQP